MNCPTCGAAVASGERFCSGCGAVVAADVAPVTPLPSVASGSLGTARKWLLAISIITLVSGLIFYGINHQESERDIAQAESMLAGRSSAEIDELYKTQTGMTFEELKAHQRGLVNLVLVANIALSIIYFGLWFWAKNNAYAASVIALLLFVTVIVISAVYEPKTLMQGILVKGLFIAALIKAVTAGREERRALGIA